MPGGSLFKGTGPVYSFQSCKSRHCLQLFRFESVSIFWTQYFDGETKKYGLKGLERIRGDERILGESDFVSDVLSLANEAYDRKYDLKRLGYDMDCIAGRVAEIFEMEREDIFRKGKHQERVKARSLFCYWMVRELGASLTDLAKRLDISVAGVGYSVDRGERIARENNYRLLDSRF